jgi:hypothetical protein
MKYSLGPRSIKTIGFLRKFLPDHHSNAHEKSPRPCRVEKEGTNLENDLRTRIGYPRLFNGLGEDSVTAQNEAARSATFTSTAGNRSQE